MSSLYCSYNRSSPLSHIICISDVTGSNVVSSLMVKEKVTVGVRENIKVLWVVYRGFGYFSFLWGKNNALFGKHKHGGILTPVGRVVSLMDHRSSRLFHMRGMCIRCYITLTEHWREFKKTTENNLDA